MIHRAALALLLLIPATLPAQQSLPHTYSTTPDVSMRIWVPTGTVRVETWDRDSVRVTGSIDKRARFYGGSGGATAKFVVENFDVQDTHLAHAGLVVTIPRKAHVWLKMTEGDVVAAHTEGELEVITVGGSVSVHDASGVVSVETIDGAVTITSVKGEARARSGGGHLTLAQIHGTLTAASVSGSIDLVGTAMADARLETIGGAITVRGTVARGALLDLETHNGPTTLYLDAGAVPALNLSTRAGVVKNGLGLGFVGAGRITARSFSGDINVVATSGVEARRNPPPL